ncbi:hypothetical protein TNCV_2397091 [Trichonephila clavipes]|uniref:Uncharacterized protein n=1 Tax=Trichonephila clavipes TaxID=2585209 RepID=A0A8X6SR79_TRICX|nr:hypothetical protein TNCV_2397091 [Trichonephila clavipes]
MSYEPPSMWIYDAIWAAIERHILLVWCYSTIDVNISVLCTRVPVPQKIFHVDDLMYVKYVKALSPHVDMVCGLEEDDANLSVPLLIVGENYDVCHQ